MDQQAWERFNYYDEFDLSWDKVKDTVPRVDGAKLTGDDFIDQYEKLYKPAMVTNAQTKWQANEKWTLKVKKQHVRQL